MFVSLNLGSAEPSADAVPCFSVLPTQSLSLKRGFQFLAAVAIDAVLAVAFILAIRPAAVKESLWKLGDRLPIDIPLKLWPKPSTEVLPTPAITKAQVKKDERRRFSAPPRTEQQVAPPVIDSPPPVIAAHPEPVPESPKLKVLVARAPALVILQLDAGSTAPKPHPDGRGSPTVPNLDPSVLRTSSFAPQGKGTGRDPLAPSGPRFSDKGGAGGDVTSPPDLSAKPPEPPARRSQPERVAFTKPEISFMPKLTYPPAALAERVEGDVRIEVTFESTGRVIFRRFVQQLPNAVLNSIARQSVEQIRFLPATRDGVPVDQDSVVVVFFRLTQPNMTASF
jgi:TonB family protein